MTIQERILASDLPTPCYVLDEAKLIENGRILKAVQERTGCKILLAQKAFSNYDLYPSIAPFLAGTEASGLYEARLGAEKMPDGECHVFCAAYRESEFEELCEFLREERIERAGIFPYSPEEGTAAAKMEDRCDEEEARRRADLVMELQAEVMDAWYESFIGKEMEVFVQGYEDMLLWGRSYADSPDIDGRVLFGGWAEPGEIAKVEITAVDNGEWIGQQI